MNETSSNAGDRARTRRNLRTARDAALTGAGVAGIVGAGILTHKGSKAIAGLAKRGRAAIRAGVKSSKGTLDTAKDVIEHNMRPVLKDAKVSTENAAAAAGIYGDVGRGYQRVKRTLGLGEGLNNLRNPRRTWKNMKEQFRIGQREARSAGKEAAMRQAQGINPQRADKVAWQRVKARTAGENAFSAFVADMTFSELSADMKKVVSSFGGGKKSVMPRYGMVVKELVAKADPHNLSTARSHVRAMSSKKLSADFNAMRGKKFILLLNDRIIDGHHFLAKAEKLGVSSALDVLDLTPLRFQQFASLHERKAFFFGADNTREQRVSNALLGGTAGAYLGGLLAGGKPVKVPVPNRLLKAVGRKAGKGLFKKIPINAARAGLTIGAVGGLASNPKKKRTGAARAVAEHGPNLVTAVQSFGFAAHVLEVFHQFGWDDFTGKAVAKAEKMLAQRKALRDTLATRIKNVAPQWRKEVARVKGVKDTVANDVRRRTAEVSRLTAKRTASRKTAGAFVAGAGAGAVAMRSRKRGVEAQTKGSAFGASGRLHQFGGEQQQSDARGRRVSPWKVWSGMTKGFVPEADPISGKKILREISPSEMPGHMQVIKGIHRAAQPVVRWGGRGTGLVKDAVSAAKGERAVDRAGRPKKREWEKPWFVRKAKEAAVVGAIGAYGLAHRRNVKVPVPNAILRKVGGKTSKGMFNKIPLQDLHKSTVNAVVKKVRTKLPDAFPGVDTFAGQLDALMTQLERVAMLHEADQWELECGTGFQPVRIGQAGKPASHQFGYDDAYLEGWDVRDPRGKSARVFAPGARKRERREKKWHEKLGNERKLWGAGLLAAGAAGLGIGRKLGVKAGLKKGATLPQVHFPNGGSVPGRRVEWAG